MFNKLFNKFKKKENKSTFEDTVESFKKNIIKTKERIEEIIKIEEIEKACDNSIESIIKNVKNILNDTESLSKNIKEYLISKLNEIERFKFADAELKYKKILLLLKYVKQFEKEALEERKKVLRDMKTLIDIDGLSIDETERILKDMVDKNKNGK